MGDTKRDRIGVSDGSGSGAELEGEGLLAYLEEHSVNAAQRDAMSFPGHVRLVWLPLAGAPGYNALQRLPLLLGKRGPRAKRVRYRGPDDVAAGWTVDQLLRRENGATS